MATKKKDDGVVNIHGKEYLTVARRVNDFREQYGQSLSLVTEIIESNDDRVVMKASIFGESGTYIATGHAEEKRGSSQINRTSALENCETSAIGRCLASFGLGGTEFASANEVQNAIHQQKTPANTKSLSDIKLVLSRCDNLKELSTKWTSLKRDISMLDIEEEKDLIAYKDELKKDVAA